MAATSATETPKSPYSVLFSISGTKAFCASGALARLPMSMMGLGIILALNHLYDNWTIAGVMSAAYVLATAAVTPLYARLFDRLGQRKVGSMVLVVQIITMLGFAFSALVRVPIPLLFALAVVMGLTQFSFGALVRTRWAYVLDRTGNGELLNTAYALESAIDEIVFIFGPILAAFLAASVHPVSQLFVPTIACALGGTIFFTLKDTQPPVVHEVKVVSASSDDADVRLTIDGDAHNTGDSGSAPRDRLTIAQLKTSGNRKKRSVFTYAGVIPLLLVFIIFNMSFTAFDTSMTAVMKSLHLDSVLGVQLAMLAVGSCMGALVFGTLRAQRVPLALHDHVPRDDHRRLLCNSPVPRQSDRNGHYGNYHRSGCFAGVRIGQPRDEGNRPRRVVDRRPFLGEHRRNRRRIIRFDDHRYHIGSRHTRREPDAAMDFRARLDSVCPARLGDHASKCFATFIDDL